MNKKSALGIVLIVLGVTLALIQQHLIDGLWLLPAISLALLTLYVAFGGHKHDANLGFLIPGCILAVVGTHALLQGYGLIPEDSGTLFLFMFGASWLIIMFVHTMRGEDRDWGSRFWPIFPALGMMVPGTMAALDWHYSWDLPELMVPLGMIAVGVFLWWQSRNNTQAK